MLNDEIVDEVRAIREAHASKFGFDLRAIYDDLKRAEAERIAAGHPCMIMTASLPPPDGV